MLEVYPLLLASLIIFLGVLIQSLIGFGLAVVATPLLYIVDPELVPVPLIILGFSTAALTLMRERVSLKFNGLQYALIGRIPGGILGTLLILIAPQAILGLAIAFIVALSVGFSLAKVSIPVNRLSLFIAGVFSGVFANIASIGGPPLAILLAGKEASQFRAALSTFFIFSSVIAFAILSVAGLVTLNHVLAALVLLPSVFLGNLAASRLLNQVNKQIVRQGTLILCSLSALSLAIKSVFTLLGY